MDSSTPRASASHQRGNEEAGGKCLVQGHQQENSGTKPRIQVPRTHTRPDSPQADGANSATPGRHGGRGRAVTTAYPAGKQRIRCTQVSHVALGGSATSSNALNRVARIEVELGPPEFPGSQGERD